MKKQRKEVSILFWPSQFSTYATLNTGNGMTVGAVPSHTPAHTFMYNLLPRCCHRHALVRFVLVAVLANSDKKHQRA
jgi:hypothetical protein